MLTLDDLNAILEYRDGALYWKVTTGRARVGASAGHVRADGYAVINWKGTLLYVHRLTFMLCTGREPTGYIDHVNGDRSDNRIENLREATPSQNLCNQKLRSDNSTGIKGVHKMKRTSKWKASIMVGGKQIHVGYFDTKEEATMAVQSKRAECHGSFAREQ